MSDIRTEIRAAFEREQSAFPPPAALRAQVVATIVNSHARAAARPPQRADRDLSWLMGAAAALVAIAIVGGLMAVRLSGLHPIGAKPGPALQRCVTGPTEPSNRFALVHGYITYTYGSEIWAVDPNHTANRISLGPSNGMTPIAWSRDGSRLLLRTPGTNSFSGDLCVINADGSQTRLTSDGLSYLGSFSPDGSKVVFSRGADDGLFVVDAKGGTPQLIAKSTANVGSVAWSPDGSRIAYIVYDEPPSTFAIWTVNPDGTDSRKLVDPARCGQIFCTGGGGLAWSPDGSMLAFQSRLGSAPSGGAAIYVVRVDGSGLRRINDDGFQPSWSPDGSRVAFLRFYGFPELSLYTMARDGSDVRPVVGVFVQPSSLAWNPVR